MSVCIVSELKVLARTIRQSKGNLTSALQFLVSGLRSEEDERSGTGRDVQVSALGCLSLSVAHSHPTVQNKSFRRMRTSGQHVSISSLFVKLDCSTAVTVQMVRCEADGGWCC